MHRYISITSLFSKDLKANMQKIGFHGQLFDCVTDIIHLNVESKPIQLFNVGFFLYPLNELKFNYVKHIQQNEYCIQIN